MKYIIPVILSEEAGAYLSPELWDKLVACSTDNVKDSIRAYIDSSDANPEILSIVKTAYEKPFKQEEFLNSEETRAAIDIVSILQYEDIAPDKSSEELGSYKKAIEHILNSEYASPYLAPIDKDAVDDLLFSLKVEMVKPGKEILREVHAKIQKFSKYFKDPNSKGYKGTSVKRITLNKTKYEVILRGINFLLEQQKNEALPTSWRYL